MRFRLAFLESSPCFPPLQVLVFTSHVQRTGFIVFCRVRHADVPLGRDEGKVVLSSSEWTHSRRPRDHGRTAPCSRNGRPRASEPASGPRRGDGSIPYPRRCDKTQRRLPNPWIRGSASSKNWTREAPQVVWEDLESRCGERSSSLSEPVSL